MSALHRSFWMSWLFLLLTIAGPSCSKPEPAGGSALRMATTTSLKDSGLLDELLPAFEKKTG